MSLNPLAASDGRNEGPLTPSAPAVGPALEFVPALARLREAGSLARAMLATTVHPAGGGCERAWLLEWNARSGLLEVRGSAAMPSPAPAPVAWLEAQAALRLEIDGSAPPPALRPQRLGGVAGLAWGGGAGTAADEPERALPWADAGHVGAVVLRRSGGPWAMIVGTWMEAPARERRDVLEAVAALCSRFVSGLDAEREARRRAQQATALAQAVRAAGCTHDLDEALQQLTRLAAQATQARGGVLWRAGAEGVRLAATYGSGAGAERVARALQPLARAVTEEGRARVVDRTTDELLLAPEVAAAVESVVAVPLRAYGRVLGALACHDRGPAQRGDPGGFSAGDVECVQALADLAALALDQAERFADARQGDQQRLELAARLERQERLAWLGELAIRMGREARNPLASIAAFARRTQRAVADGDAAREYAEIILREAERLERLFAEQREFATPVQGALRLESLNAVVQEVLSGCADVLVRRRVRLVKRLAPELPALLLDRDRIRRSVASMMESALEAVAVGGRIRIETRRLDGAVVLELAHDGPRDPGGLLEEVFVPFASGRAGGPSVGLGVARQIVRGHGGEVRVRSEGEWGAIFSLSLPVHRNEDRRRAAAERRRAGADRRAPLPPSGASGLTPSPGA